MACQGDSPQQLFIVCIPSSNRRERSVSSFFYSPFERKSSQPLKLNFQLQIGLPKGIAILIFLAMKLGVFFLVLYQLLHNVLADATVTTTNIDFAGTYQGDMSNLLTRVQKKVDIRYSYSLNPNQAWNQFQGMAIQFDLEFAQYVSLRYSINQFIGGSSYFLIRVLIDNNQIVDFRTSTGYSDIHRSHTSYDQLWLPAGRHTAKVEYRTSGNYNMDFWDWNNAVFKIKYFKK